MPYLRCSTQSLPEAVLLRVEGEVDLATAPVLADAITGAFAEHSRVIVDLNGVPYLDSAGLHVLARTATRYAGRFVVIQAIPRVRRLFEILGIIALLPLVASLNEAQDYLRGGDGHRDGDGQDASAVAAADDQG